VIKFHEEAAIKTAIENGADDLRTVIRIAGVEGTPEITTMVGRKLKEARTTSTGRRRGTRPLTPEELEKFRFKGPKEAAITIGDDVEVLDPTVIAGFPSNEARVVQILSDKEVIVSPIGIKRLQKKVNTNTLRVLGKE
jgi:hypothetical protein